MNVIKPLAAPLLTRIKILATRRAVTIAAFCSILFALNAGFVPAQTGNFYQTGRIRAIVSETKPKLAPMAAPAAESVAAPAADSRIKFYFTYSHLENGAPAEKWIALPDDRDWRPVANQKALVSGSLMDGKLSNPAVTLLEARAETAATSPPPTVGLYKIVVVLLTIQPPTAGGKPGENAPAALTVTPEQVRAQFFSAPNSVNNFYREASFGRFGFTGVHDPQVDIVPVTIQTAISNDCHAQIMNQFTTTVRQRLLEQNIDTMNGSVDLGIIIFNDVAGCPTYPFATRGVLGRRGTPEWVWSPEVSFATGPLLMAHEIGHALGGNHPLAMRCTNFNDPQSCTYTDAFDRDIMTSNGRSYHLPNNFNRRRWGWHPPEAFVNASTGSHRLYELRSPGLPFGKDGARAGRFFFRQLGGSYNEYDIYPEGRQRWGEFDRYQAADEAYLAGISLRIGHRNFGDPDAYTLLIDPNSTPHEDDAPLRENQQFSIGGVTVRCEREHNPRRGTRMSLLEP